MPERLLDSELFGYVRGAFTGAEEDHPGLFEAANGGTLFLDEVEQMSEAMQTKLLRVIEEKKVRPLGGITFTEVDVRIISATNSYIKDLIKQGKFREDLFYRLATVVIRLPPLRERRDDIPLLLDFFLERLYHQKGIRITFEEDALEELNRYNWPGNVRELENLILRLSISGKERISADDLGLRSKGVVDLKRFEGKTLAEAEADFTRELINKVLEETGWDITSASKRLSIPQSTLYHRIKQLGIRKVPKG
jgi:transcriptional regulator with PAS, ATPase and Fis domain